MNYFGNVFIITVHHGTNRWMQIQNTYIKNHTSLPYQVVAVVNDNLKDKTPKGWMTIGDQGITDHAKKLNIAGDFVSNFAGKDDLIVFLDSDCFPVSDWLPTTKKILEEKEAVAIQRIENCGDIQPHPCFTIMKASLWKKINGDWKSGYEWINSHGHKTTDVGGNLLEIFKSNNINWEPIHRSNTFNPHPLFFGIYGGMFYHHGAGSRIKYDRVDRYISDAQNHRLTFAHKKTLDLTKAIKKLTPIKIQNSMIYRLALSLYSKILILLSEKKLKNNTSLSDLVYKLISEECDLLAIFQYNSHYPAQPSEIQKQMQIIIQPQKRHTNRQASGQFF